MENTETVGSGNGFFIVVVVDGEGNPIGPFLVISRSGVVVHTALSFDGAKEMMLKLMLELEDEPQPEGDVPRF